MDKSSGAKNICLYKKHKSAFEEIFYDMDNSVWKLKNILKDFKYKEDTENSYAFSSEENKFFVQLYKLIAYTRDISRGGEGNRTNTYAQLVIWDRYFPELAKEAIKQLVMEYGCWRDIRQFCNYYMDYHGKQKVIVRIGKSPVVPEIVDYCIDLMTSQLFNDCCSILDCRPISNASKWCPREKNKQYGWLFFHLACRYFKCDESTPLLCKNFRSVLTSMNRYNNVPQVNFCSNNWSNIDHTNVTYKTYLKNKPAIHNLTLSGDIRCPNSLDRNKCADNFFLYSNQFNSPCKSYDKDYLFTLFRNELVNKVVNLYNLRMRNQGQFANIDNVWKTNSEYFKIADSFTNIIPIIDTSIAMKNDGPESSSPFINAITIASTILDYQNKIRRSGEYKIGLEKIDDTLLCNYANYEESAQFKTLDTTLDDSITSVLTHLLNGLRPNYNTANDGLTEHLSQFDFSKFYDLFLMKLVYEKHHPDVANKKTLLFMCGNLDRKKLERKIKKKYDKCVLNYHRTGIKLMGFPYMPPKIIVWNMATPDTDLPLQSGFSIGKKNLSEIHIINSQSDSRFNGFNNFTERFLKDGHLDNCFTRQDNINENLDISRYEDFNPFYV